MTSISTLVIVLVFGLLILGSLACQIYVASRVYQDKGSGRIILGIFWGRRTFINGWQRADELGIKDIMIFWSFLVGLLVLSICGFVGYFVVTGAPAGR